MSTQETYIELAWNRVLQEQFAKRYWRDLFYFVATERRKQKVYPPVAAVFTAFERCPFTAVKVVILGQDPYHGVGQAHGLCFSVPDGVRVPPSLKNIYKELQCDVGKEVPTAGNLEHWADQGVLLLNTTLTVRAGVAGSHQGKGWETFTDAVIKKVSDEREHVVFMLWGNYAREKKSLINSDKHLVLEAPHPSPFSARTGFFGCKHFSKANVYFHKHGMQGIQW